MVIGGGTVFKFSTSSLQTLYAFCADANCPDGTVPIIGLSMDPLGNLFGEAGINIATSHAGRTHRQGEFAQPTETSVTASDNARRNRTSRISWRSNG